MRTEYTQEDYKFVNSVEGSVHRALWGEVIPSMRQVSIMWRPGDKIVWVYFYHDGEITEEIDSHYSSIMAEVDADYWGRDVETDYKAIRLDYPKLFPKDDFVVYRRKEPFVDPT